MRGVTRWKVGDRVMGLVGGGAQAELVTVHQDETLAIPDGLSYAEAAAIPEVFLTAYDALVTRGRLAPGGRVLVHAVGSGVGTAATQIAKHLGATVLGTSRSAEKLARALVYGLDHGIDTCRAARFGTRWATRWTWCSTFSAVPPSPTIWPCWRPAGGWCCSGSSRADASTATWARSCGSGSR